MDAKVNLADKLRLFQDRWAPRIVADLDDYKISVVKVQGDFVRHARPETDELFLVLEGRLDIRLRDGTVTLRPGELHGVPRGVEHCPRATEQAHLLLVEPAGTPNTGTAGGERTAPERRV